MVINHRRNGLPQIRSYTVLHATEGAGAICGQGAHLGDVEATPVHLCLNCSGDGCRSASASFNSEMAVEPSGRTCRQSIARRFRDDKSLTSSARMLYVGDLWISASMCMSISAVNIYIALYTFCAGVCRVHYRHHGNCSDTSLQGLWPGL